MNIKFMELEIRRIYDVLEGFVVITEMPYLLDLLEVFYICYEK